MSSVARINSIVYKSLMQELALCITRGELTNLKALVNELEEIKKTYDSNKELATLTNYFSFKPFENIREIELDKIPVYDPDTDEFDFVANGKTLLEILIEKCHANRIKQFDILKYLVEECGFDLNRRNSKTGKTPFILFSKHMYDSKHEMFMYMIEKGARVDPCDKNEFTSSLTNSGCVLGQDKESLVKSMDAQIKLLTFCYEINMLDDLNNVSSVFDNCLLNKCFNFRLYDWLKSHGAKITDCKDPILIRAFIKNALDWYYTRGKIYERVKPDSLFLDEAIISKLEADGFSWTQVDKNGNNILHMLQFGYYTTPTPEVYVEIIRFLKSKGLDILQLCRQENNEKKTPLDNAHLSPKTSFKSILKECLDTYSLFSN